MSLAETSVLYTIYPFQCERQPANPGQPGKPMTSGLVMWYGR
jgi:hypothetical protein